MDKFSSTNEAIQALLSIFEAEVGYLEKASNKDLDDKTANAGYNNYTKYARDLFPALQGQPWCDMFFDWCMVQTFKNGPAKDLLCGAFDAYTPSSAQYYKNKGQYFKTPEVGDQIFFQNGIRIYHTGVVTAINGNYINTIEGNTSGGVNVDANGGGVFAKTYAMTNSRIDGYGRPDYNVVVSPSFEIGWHHDHNGWWYAFSENDYYTNTWKDIQSSVSLDVYRYYFNPDGYAVTDWEEIDGEWYYFEPRAGHPQECALYKTDENGKQSVGKF